MKIGYIDHYDSFSFNLVDWLCSDPDFSVDVEHVYFDDAEALSRLYQRRCPLVFSPGPKSPRDIPQSMELLQKSLGKVPILGVCLGFQMLGVGAGLTLRRASEARHGVARPIKWSLPAPDLASIKEGNCLAGVYNSLGFQLEESQANLRKPWGVVGSDAVGNVQAILYSPKNGEAVALGVQFHPESFLSIGTEAFRSYWLSMASKAQQQPLY